MNYFEVLTDGILDEVREGFFGRVVPFCAVVAIFGYGIVPVLTYGAREVESWFDKGNVEEVRVSGENLKWDIFREEEYLKDKALLRDEVLLRNGGNIGLASRARF